MISIVEPSSVFTSIALASYEVPIVKLPVHLISDGVLVDGVVTADVAVASGVAEGAAGKSVAAPPSVIVIFETVRPCAVIT